MCYLWRPSRAQYKRVKKHEGLAPADESGPDTMSGGEDEEIGLLEVVTSSFTSDASVPCVVDLGDGKATRTCEAYVGTLEKVSELPFMLTEACRASGDPELGALSLVDLYLKDRIKVMLGGRCSQKLIYGEVSTGAQNDLKEATALIRKMIGQWGMSEKIGPLGLNIGEEHVFLGREIGMPREFSEKMAEMIDEEIQSQLLALEKATLDFLTEHRNQLDALAKAVLKKETLSAEDVEEILRKEDARKIA